MGKIMLNDIEYGSGGGGSDLPSVTAADEGKILAVDSNGNWGASDAVSEELSEFKQDVNGDLQTQNDNIAVLVARMDTFASLPDGSTSGNAELLDIRVGADGTIYPSAGDAVRGQVEELNNSIDNQKDYLVDHYLGLNICDDTEISTETNIDYTTGNEETNANYNSTGFIKIEDNVSKITAYSCRTSELTPQNGYWQCAFYNEDKTFISNSGIRNNSGLAGSTVDIPSGAKYFRCSFAYHANFTKYMVVYGDSHDANYVEYGGYGVEEIPTKTSQLENDSNFMAGDVDGKLPIAELSEYEEIIGNNLLDPYAVLANTAIDTYGNEVSSSGKATTGFIGIEYTKSYIFMKINSAQTGFSASLADVYYYDENKDYISNSYTRFTSPNFSTPITVPSASAKYMRIVSTDSDLSDGSSEIIAMKYIVGNTTYWRDSTYLFRHYEAYYKKVGLPKNVIIDLVQNLDTINTRLNLWEGKKFALYGDSITAINNGYDDPEVTGSYKSWGQHIRDKLLFSQMYSRGIGGQTYKYNKKPWFANSDGTYNSRDDSGDMTDPSSYIVPTGCTAHYGYFASWDRITTMFPDSIKDDVDLIIVMGVNDGSNTDVGTIPLFSTSNTLDAEWALASENELSGDYDITTLNGAIASTIMKLQTRCPNALIVMMTGWSGRGDNDNPSANLGNYTSSGIGIWQEGKIVEYVADYLSIPLIDLWKTSLVNCLNRNQYDYDVIHPYTAKGNAALARAVISGLLALYPRFDTV